MQVLPTPPRSSGRRQGQMGVHSGTPQGVCDTQLGTGAGPSGCLAAFTAPASEGMRGIKCFWNCLWYLLFGNNPVRRERKLFFSSASTTQRPLRSLTPPTATGLPAGRCCRSHGGRRCRYCSEITVFDLRALMWFSMWHIIYTATANLAAAVHKLYVSSRSDKNHKVRSGRSVSVKPIWCTYPSISFDLFCSLFHLTTTRIQWGRFHWLQRGERRALNRFDRNRAGTVSWHLYHRSSLRKRQKHIIWFQYFNNVPLCCNTCRCRHESILLRKVLLHFLSKALIWGYLEDRQIKISLS